MTALKLGDAVRHRRLGWRGTISAIVHAAPLGGPHRPYVVRRVTPSGTAIVSCAADELELIVPPIDAGLTADESLVDLTALDLGGRVVPFRRPALRVIQGGGGDSVA